jgi:hypothetical protein
MLKVNLDMKISREELFAMVGGCLGEESGECPHCSTASDAGSALDNTKIYPTVKKVRKVRR